MGKVSVAIMAHPKRAEFIPSLLESLDREPAVVWDQINDRWDTGRRSMLAFDRGATHHLVVQDDAVLCKDLVAGLERAVEFSGDNPVGLYAGKLRPNFATMAMKVDEARRLGRSWAVFGGPWWGVGIVVSAAEVPEMVAWCDANPTTPNYDHRIANWFASQGRMCWYTVPSLVDHRVEGNPSLVPGRTGKRAAYRFIGKESSALDVDWSALPSIEPPEGGFYRFEAGFVCWFCGKQLGDKGRILTHVRRDHFKESRALAVQHARGRGAVRA